MNIPLPSETYAFLLHSVAALTVFAAVKYGAGRITAGRSEGRAPAALFLAGWFVAGVAAGATWYGLSMFTSKFLTPEIAIVNPQKGAKIDAVLTEDGGYFMVNGTSANVVGNGSLRIVLLVHSADPFTEGWWAQAAPVTEEKSGKWSSIAWLGKKEYPPVEGQKYEMIALVVKEQNIKAEDVFRDPGELTYIARSENSYFEVGKLISEK